MRLVYYYTRARNVFIDDFLTDGRRYLFEKMIEHNIISECLVIIDNYAIDPLSLNISDKFNIISVKDVNQTRNILKANDIIFIRGGFKPWISLINRLINNKHWIVFYGANTGNERWPYWDIILDDLNDKTFIDTQGRLIYQYLKPVNEKIFRFKNFDRIYDVMIGASHVHDKKGQWKAVDKVIEYKKRGINLKCVFPGGFKKGLETSKIRQKIFEHDLDIKLIGMVSRPELADYYNRAKLLIKNGGGQNDRSLLEAVCCGCAVQYEMPERSAPFLKEFLSDIGTEINNNNIAKRFKELSGVDEVILPSMRKLFDFFLQNPKPDKNKLVKLI